MIKAILCDVDGTLVDTVDLHANAWREAFLRFGKDIPFDQLRSQIGKGGDQLMPVFLTRRELAAFGRELEEFRSELYEKKYLPSATAFPKVRDLFERLREDGIGIALASSCKQDELDTYEALARIDDLVDAATSADDADRGKPHPDIFEVALAKLGDVAPHESLVIGDSPHDARAAGKIGVAAIGLLCGGFPMSDLVEAGCIAIYGSPGDLLEHYTELPLGDRASRRPPASKRGAA